MHALIKIIAMFFIVINSSNSILIIHTNQNLFPRFMCGGGGFGVEI
jgi:hypothetical protein